MKHHQPISFPFFILLIFCSLLQGCAMFSLSPDLNPPPEEYWAAPGAHPEILESEDNLTLFSQWWLPETPQTPKAVLLFLHGTIAHSGFYSPMANHFSQQGYAVLGVDFRGWGQSQGHGRNGVIDSYDDYLLDLNAAYQQAKNRYPDLPIYLQGESMGGTIALLSQIEGTIAVDGLILNAPAVRPGLSFGPLNSPNWLSDAGLWMLSQPGKVFPNMPAFYHGGLLERLGVGLMLKEKENRKRFLDDPHNTHKALPFGYFTGLHKATARVEDGLKKVTAPVLIQQGTRDVLVPPKSSEFTLEQLGSTDKTLNVYDKLTHATLHDRRRETVWADILLWVEERLPEKTEEPVNRDKPVTLKEPASTSFHDLSSHGKAMAGDTSGQLQSEQLQH